MAGHDRKDVPDVIVLVCIDSEPLRTRVLEVLTSERFDFCNQPIRPHVRQAPVLDAIEHLESLYHRFPSVGVIFLSDGLIDSSGGRSTLSLAGQRLFDLFGQGLYATIALSEEGDRVTDVDRVVSPNAGIPTLRENVQLCLDRLAYLRPPVGPGSIGPIEIRQLQYEREFREYFTLRHRVYRVMCYLERRLEDNPAGMEIDWFDTQAIHFGAFVRRDGYEELVGTARLITTTVIDDSQRQRILDVIHSDAYLLQVVENGAILTQLPVFQSQNLLDLLAQAVNDELIVGEVSRVIVRQDQRGRGLSGLLVAKLSEVATRREVSDLLLECLPVHARVYKQNGFRPLPKIQGNVYGINRTMIVMHRQLGTRSVLLRGRKKTRKQSQP